MNIADLPPEKQEEIRARRRVASAKYYASHLEKKREAFRKWRINNMEKRRITNRKYRKAHPDANRENVRRWKKNNREKVRAHNKAATIKRRGAVGSHTLEETKKLLWRQKYKCSACKVIIKVAYHEDHIVPLVRGGSNYIRNIQLLCPECNYRKHTKDPIVFMQEMGFLL